jgi:PKD repeat protein
MNKKLIRLICIGLIIALTSTGALAQNPQPQLSKVDELAEHVPGEVLIRFSPWVNSTQATIQMEQMKLKLKRDIPALEVKLVKLPPGLSVEDALSRISQRPGVEFVEPNYILRIEGVNQEEITDQWSLEKIRAIEAWGEIPESQKTPVTLATVDTGVDPTHNDLVNNIWSNPGEIAGNGIDDDNNGYIDDTWGWDFVNNDNDPFDDNLHGTAVSSVMAGDLDGDGVAGVCPWCEVMAVKVLSSTGTGTLDVVASGIIYAADRGAKVINLSLAGTAGMETLENAVNHAWNKGALVAAGAGNDGANAPMYPAGYANAMAIASTGESDYHSCFSNYANGYISVAAPGENILVALPDQSYGVGSGTSLSTPLVVGLGGLLLSQDSSRTNSDLRSIIESTAVDLSPEGIDAAFGHGRIDAFRAVTNDTSQVTPPDGRFSTNGTASGYAHARKLVRDSNGTLHMIWHTQEGSNFRIRHATSINDGSSWNLEDDVFSSPLETYHPALATDGQNLFVAIPSRIDVDQPYQILFTQKPVSTGSWSQPESLMGGTYHAVRPDLFFDSTNGRLHLVASSFDDSPYIYYLASGDQGVSWDTPVAQVNPSTGTEGQDSKTRYGAVHAHGNNIYIVTRTVNSAFFTYYYMHTVRSTDGGQTWFDQTKISSYLAFLTGEYGISIAGVGDRLYMGYEVGGNMYFRHHNGTTWSDYETLELGDSENVYKWPTITQADDGQAWLMFEVNGDLYLRHYDGNTWAPKELIGSGNYANFKLGTAGDRIHWLTTQCNGAPFLVSHDSRTIGSNNPPTANFSYTTADLTATFTDTSIDSDGTIDNWAWTFGDGNSSSEQNPVHSYASTGTYTVSLTITDDDGATDTASQDVTVSEPLNSPPTASFTFSTTDLTANFYDSSSDIDGTVNSWSWDFGDGYFANLKNPVHIYSAAGTYTVSLTVTDNDGATDTASQSVTVTVPNSPPAASFTFEITDLTATFTDTSTDSGGTIDVWAWDFGDGNISSLQNPIHSYSAAGTYTVSLTVTDDGSATDSVSQNVTVTEPPNEPPTASFTYSTTDLTATFSDDSTDNDGWIVGWAWDFGDSGTSIVPDPVYPYLGAGTYTVTLTVTDNDGATDTASQSVTVTAPNSPPTASFTYSTANLTATFTDTSTDSGGIVEIWAWNFGDGNNSSEQNPVHSYSAAGTYTVSLTVTDDNGASDSTSQEVMVTEPPVIVDTTATGEIPVAGTVTGNYLNTNADDETSQAITERESGGKKPNRYSFLEHKWIFNVPAGIVVSLHANAWMSDSSDGDSFTFAYSKDDVNYTEMFTVDTTSTASNVENYIFPEAIQGTVYIRVTDNDHNAGNRELNAVYIDHLFIRSETQAGDPPAAPTGLSVLADSPTQISLSWSDNSIDEQGFQIDRSLDGTNWSQIDIVGADNPSYIDATVSPKTTYFYRVRAFNGSGASGNSKTAFVTTPDGLSLSATGIKIKGEHTVDLTWGGGSVSEVVIYRDGSMIDTVANVDMYTDNTGNKGGASYRYQVCDSSNPSNCSNTVQIDF